MDTLYVSDMDCTLLNSDSLISTTTASTLRRLSEQGAMITVATARTPATVVPLLSDCRLRVPYIVMTGAATFDPVTMRYGNIIALDIEQVAEAAYKFASYGINPFFYQLGDDGMLTAYHAPAMTPMERRFYEARASSPLKRFTFNPVLPHGGNFPLIFAVAEAEKLEPVAEDFINDDLFQVSYYPDPTAPGFTMIELFAKGVSKAVTTSVIAGRLGAPRIVAFGDNFNDLALFEAADVAVAVANAQPEVKQAADIVIGTNDEDAVARFIEEDFLSQRQ